MVGLPKFQPLCGLLAQETWPSLMSQTVPTVTAAKRRQRCPAAFYFWGLSEDMLHGQPTSFRTIFRILDRVGMDFPIQAAGTAGSAGTAGTTLW